MRRIWLLVAGFAILSACTGELLEDIDLSLPGLRSTPTATPQPTPTWTPSPVPTQTPISFQFEVGEPVFLVPDLIDAVFGPFKLGREIQYMQVAELQCGDYDTYQLSRVWVYHGQQGMILDRLACGLEEFYKLGAEEWTYADKMDIWVRLEQVSASLPTKNYPFILGFPTDFLDEINNSPYYAYIPPHLPLEIGMTGNTTINDHLVQMTLIDATQVLQGESKYYRHISTIILIENRSPDPVDINSKQLFQARANAMGVPRNVTSTLSQRYPANAVVEPGESVEIEIVWSFARTVLSDQLAVYLAVNTAIEDSLYIIVNEDSIFFRTEIVLND